MSKVILICGKICSGKTTYAKQIMKEQKAVHLSCDEITLAMFGQNIGEKHDEIVELTMEYLYRKSLEILEIGVTVILDFGFWEKEDREKATLFYTKHNITPEWHYVDVENSVWKRNIKKRHAAILNNETNDYYIDEPLAEKFGKLFQPPTKDEIDVWYINDQH